MDREGLEAKYVVCNIDDDELVIVFSFMIKHSTFQHLNPIRAGFVSFEGGKAKCFGDSFTLNLESDEILDSHLVNQEILNQ